MNVVNLIGYVGKDPELRHTNGTGQSVVNLELATRESFSDKAGVEQTRTEWHRLVFWGKLAELVAAKVRAGDQVGVEGKLQTRKWRDKENQPRSTTEVVATRVHLDES